MNNTPLISVVIPVYGVETYLQQCIDSLMNQTLKNVEYIFVNDASPDNCLSILHENEALHPDCIRVIDSPFNLKQGGARNLGVDAARAEWIGFVDSDDFVASSMFEKLYERAENSGTDVVFVQYSAINSSENYNDEYRIGGGYSINPMEYKPHQSSGKGIVRSGDCSLNCLSDWGSRLWAVSKKCTDG